MMKQFITIILVGQLHAIALAGLITFWPVFKFGYWYKDPKLAWVIIKVIWNHDPKAFVWRGMSTEVSIMNWK